MSGAATTSRRPVARRRRRSSARGARGRRAAREPLPLRDVDFRTSAATV